MIKKILKFIPHIIMSRSKRTNNIPNPQINNKSGFWTNLVKDDNNFSTVNFFLVAATIVGILLLIMPMIAMGVDLYYNHTLTINLSDMSAYIIAVAGIFGAAGFTNAWTEYSYQRYHKNIFDKNSNNNTYINNNNYNTPDTYIDNSQVEEQNNEFVEN